jgi:C-type mannose receptor
LSKIDGRFQWQDGSNLSFTNWNNGEPNNYGGVEKCVELFVESGKWNDMDCKYLRPSICKKGEL